MTKQILTVGSLFAGIGGIELGLERAQHERYEFKTAWQVEIDPYAQKVLAKHWPDCGRWDDVRTFPPAPAEDWEVDVICGGFPCQDISMAGKRAGITGHRSGLWSEFIRTVRVLRPMFVIVENVARLLVDGLGTVLGDLAASGYSAEWQVLPAKAFGAPHERERAFIICYPDTPRRKGHNRTSVVLREKPGKGCWWASEPNVCRVVNGVSGQVDGGGGNLETAALASAVVPQVAQWIGERILESL